MFDAELNAPHFLEAMGEGLRSHLPLRARIYRDGDRRFVQSFAHLVEPRLIAVDFCGSIDAIAPKLEGVMGMGPLDLANEGTLRWMLARLSNKKFALLFCIHHAAVDLHSMSVLDDIVRRASRGTDKSRHAHTSRYLDLLAEDTEFRASTAFEDSSRYWKSLLSRREAHIDLGVGRRWETASSTFEARDIEEVARQNECSVAELMACVMATSMAGPIAAPDRELVVTMFDPARNRTADLDILGCLARRVHVPLVLSPDLSTAVALNQPRLRTLRLLSRYDYFTALQTSLRVVGPQCSQVFPLSYEFVDLRRPRVLDDSTGIVVGHPRESRFGSGGVLRVQVSQTERDVQLRVEFGGRRLGTAQAIVSASQRLLKAQPSP